MANYGHPGGEVGGRRNVSLSYGWSITGNGCLIRDFSNENGE